MDQKIISRLDAVVLCGGRGSRIVRIAKDNPKILLTIGGKPLIDIILSNLIAQGFRRVVLCAGYLANKIETHIASKKNFYNSKLEIVFSREDTVLGTGGAIKNAEPLIKGDPFVVINGDGLFNLDFDKFHKFHLANGSFISLAMVHEQLEKDYGIISVDRNMKISNFNEKDTKTSGFVSIGVYLMNRGVFSLMEKSNFSIEYDFFPRILKRGCYGFLTNGKFIDIGTPERYKRAQIA